MHPIARNSLAAAILGSTVFMAGCSSTMNLSTSRPYQQTFLKNYNLLQPRGSDFVYFAPDAQKMLASAKGVMIDQPEIHIAATSPYTGAKPADLTAIAEAMRADITDSLTKAGYTVATAPGPNVVLVRIALTDVYLEEKPRGVLEYTPIGFVVGAGISAMQSVMQKVDILGMTLQAEITDSGNNALLGELVAQRGSNEQRITYDQFQDQMKVWGQRLACQLSNSKLAAGQQVDCSKIGNTG